NPVPYPAFVTFPERTIISISPELFVQKNGNKIISAPMKGTIARKMTYEADLLQKDFLRTDEKNCAENLMIVDMVRNDLGKFCDANSIFVNPLFHVDSYRTVHQMISLVHGQSHQGLSTIFREMFPAASITGAPKIRAMEIIHELEASPRHVYCGALGSVEPNGDLCFNVPIRTLTCEQDKTLLGIGSGVVADSVDNSEWQECLLKASFVNHYEPVFNLFETLRWTFEEGYSDLDAHLQRLTNSQRWFNRKVNNWREQLPQSFNHPQRIKLIVDVYGILKVEASPQGEFSWGKELILCKISDKVVNSKDIFLYHKTTNRAFYQSELSLAKQENFDEVIFFNERGELTEGSISNIFIMVDNQWFTPSLECGLLPGIERAKLLKELSAKEFSINREMFDKAQTILLCNSLRGVVKTCCKN
ncbi:MAG: chorismate-binding protein, partial [Lentisphaeria bacterium]